MRISAHHMWEFKWPVIGILVPCLLIASIAYGSHYFVFRHSWAAAAQARYQVYVSMVWLSYVVAIRKSPGAPAAGHCVPEREWKRWCNKCRNYKPERAHHCRKCGVCVLQMDHHCPWTNNCVGHGNMPHFMRFLVWVVFATGVTMAGLASRAYAFWQERHVPAYLVSKTELAAVIVLLPVDVFVFLSVALLLVKCSVHIASGKTQIEVWECERIESQLHTERLWLKIRHNYRQAHGKDMPELTSWNPRPAHELHGADYELRSRSRSPVVPQAFTADDVIFPYDVGVFANVLNALNYPWIFVLPWGGARGDGHRFAKSDDGDQLDLPWPPDGGDVDFEGRTLSDDELRQLGNIALLRKHLDPRSNMRRQEWTNGMGERLVDYGVDMDAEEEVALKSPEPEE